MIEQILQLALQLWQWLPEFVRILVFNVTRIVIVIVPLTLSVAYLTLAERKIIGYMQVRIGPNRVGPKGFLQPIADAMKLMFKEVILPTNANPFLFYLAPVLVLGPSLAAWAAIPFGANSVIANIDAGLLYILAISSISVYGIIIAGWASNSKYAFLGAMRSAAQMVSYEIAMGFALVGVLMVSGSLNLGEIVKVQQGGLWNWMFLPLFPLFLIYFISGIAETNRAPFDVAEGESEIVAGFHVDYSGIAFALFFLGEYANIILVGTLTVLMFLGGWLSPLEGLPEVLFGMSSETVFAIPYIGVLFGPGLHWLLLKAVFVIFFFLWFRATFPRYRYDQIMRLGWKVFLPITIVWLVVVGVVMAYMRFGPWF